MATAAEAAGGSEATAAAQEPQTQTQTQTETQAPSGSRPSGNGIDRVDTNSISRGAEGYRHVADLASSLANEVHHLAGRRPLQHNSPDSTWNAFAVKYVPSATGLANNMKLLARSLHATADNLDAMGKNFAAAEDHGVETARYMGKVMGQGLQSGSEGGDGAA